MEIQYLLFVLLGFSASIISSVFGFGTALVVLAVGAHILPASEAIALATVLFTASTVFKTILLRDHIDWKMVGTMTVTSLPFAYLGASLLSHIPTDMLQRLLGIMVLGYLLLSRIKHTPKVRPGTVNLIAASATYGLISGLLGSGSIVKAIVFREMRLHKAAFVGVMAATAVMANIAKLAVFIQFCAQVMATCRLVSVCSVSCCAVFLLLPLPRRAGVTNARCLLFGANTPWQRTWAAPSGSLLVWEPAQRAWQ